MQQDRTRRNERTPAEENADMEGAVLALLIDEHPTRLTVLETVKAMFVGPEDRMARDEVERAVRDLVAVGLVHRHDDFVFPTRAALRREEITM